MRKMIVLVYLLLLGFFDLREKKVPVILLGVGSVLAFGIQLSISMTTAEDPRWFMAAILLSVLPGVFMLGISWVTGKAGVGDGWALLNLGLFTDYKTCIMLWGISMLVMAVISGSLLAFRKVKYNTRLPYLPFLASVYTVIFICEKGS